MMVTAVFARPRSIQKPNATSSVVFPFPWRTPVRCSDYTHIISLGGNDLAGVVSAFSRYAIGGADYVDPVLFENVFEIVDGIPSLTFEPVIRVRQYCSLRVVFTLRLGPVPLMYVGASAEKHSRSNAQ